MCRGEQENVLNFETIAMNLLAFRRSAPPDHKPTLDSHLTAKRAVYKAGRHYEGC